MKITVQIDGEPKECAMLLDALNKIGEEAQINDLVYRPNNPYPHGKGITTGTPLPPQDVTVTSVTCKKE